MSGARSIPYATYAILGVLAILWGQAGVAQQEEASDVFEVKVLDAQVSPGQGGLSDVLYQMEILSVIRSASKVEANETITVRAAGQSGRVLEPGWTGTAYLDPAPNSAATQRQFVVSSRGEGLVKLPPGPPSATSTVWKNAKGEVVESE